MIAFITVFVIAGVGMAILLWCKLAEERSGRRLFLPGWLAERDSSIERTARFYAKAILWWVKHKLRMLVHLFHRGSVQLLVRVAQRTHPRHPFSELRKNGRASAYLKDIALHKETARRENGHTNK